MERIDGSELLKIRAQIVDILEQIDKLLPKTQVLNHRIDIDLLMSAALKFYGITKAELIQKKRGHSAQRRRVICAVLYNNMTGATYRKIADKLGYKEHETVIHHERIINSALNGDCYGYDAEVREYKSIVKIAYAGLQ